MTRPTSVTLTAWIALAGAAWSLLLGLLALLGLNPVEGVPGLAQAAPPLLYVLIWGAIGYLILRQARWVGLFALVGALQGLVGGLAALSSGDTVGSALHRMGQMIWGLVVVGLLVLLFLPPVRRALKPERKRPFGVALVSVFYFVKFFATVSLLMMTLVSVLSPESSVRPLDSFVAWVLLPLALVLMGVTFLGGMGLSGLYSWGWKYVVGLHWFAVAASVVSVLAAASVGRMDAGDLGQVFAGFLYLGAVLGYLYRPKVRGAFEA